MADNNSYNHDIENVNSNFISFFKEHNIEIPLIQRDYVQGSDFQSKKRNEFLDALFDALRDDKKTCELEFIYGTYNNGTFLPLDGQQRLTTLFLLHWFLINKSRLENPDYTNTLIETIKWNDKVFKYKTRRSSTTFCEKLLSYTPKEFTQNISHDLIKQSWFSEDWLSDPTILAMLNMLDALMQKYMSQQKENATQLLERLLTTSAINFDKLDMGKYKLNDSLYIKMNARGKQLTAFENWKAKFIKILEDVYNDADYKYAENNRIKFYHKIKDYFSHSIEHEWTDLFWSYAVEDYKKRATKYDALSEEENLGVEISNPIIDEYFLNFYRYIYQLLFFIDFESDVLESDENKDYNKIIEDNYLNADLFKKENNIEFLYQSLDLFSNIQNNNADGINTFFTDLLYSEGNFEDGKIRLFSSEKLNLFDSCINNKIPVDEQVLLFCIIKYCIKYKCYKVNEYLKIYVRVCRNLLESINQRLTQDMKLHSNVRLSQLSKYVKTIDDLCAQENLLGKNSLILGMGDTDSVLNVLKYYPNNNIFSLEDSGFTHGCLDAFDFNINFEDILLGFNAFKKAKDIDRVRILAAYGFEGADFGWCAHGRRIFYGYHDRWNMLFRYKSDALALKKALRSFIIDYKQNNNIQDLINNKLNGLANNDSFLYYFLKYDAFTNSSLWWIMDDDQYDTTTIDAHHFFAILSEHDIITLPRFNSNPLLGYHTEPYACAVAQEIKKTYPEIYQKINYTGNNRYKAKLTFDDNNLELSCSDNGWFISFSSEDNKNHLSYSKLKYLLGFCDSFGKNSHYIHNDNTHDRVETAVNFIALMYK